MTEEEIEILLILLLKAADSTNDRNKKTTYMLAIKEIKTK